MATVLYSNPPGRRNDPNGTAARPAAARVRPHGARVVPAPPPHSTGGAPAAGRPPAVPRLALPRAAQAPSSPDLLRRLSFPHRLASQPSTPTPLATGSANPLSRTPARPAAPHGLTSRVFPMKWFKWTVDQFEHLNNFDNCEFHVMQLGPGGEYSLLVHHTKEELAPAMGALAEDDRRSAVARLYQSPWANECSSFLPTFFDNWNDDEDDGHCVEENGKINNNKLLE
uniref:Uncharacterized protein n=1 Tax=Leersia perrieri TaxID=77586 RepID=A0A0D9VJQ8_9ORYZ